MVIEHVSPHTQSELQYFSGFRSQTKTQTRTFAVRSIRKQRSGEDPNKAIFILKCEMDLSKSGSDHYCNPKLDVNVNRGKLPQGVVIQRHSGFDWMFNEFCLSD